MDPASATDQNPIISLDRVTKVYETAAGGLTALSEITTAFYPGELVGVIGKSGAGKSTLVNMLTGVDRLTSGEIVIAGQRLNELNESAMALWRGGTIGVIYQTFELLPGLSLLDNVLLPMDFCGLYRGKSSTLRAIHLLEQVGLEDHTFKTPSKVSGGQRQRAAIARALANDPPIIVADEPTGNLDSQTADGIFELFTALAAAGKTIVMVTHDESLAERMTRVLHIADGELVGDAQRESISTH